MLSIIFLEKPKYHRDTNTKECMNAAAQPSSKTVSHPKHTLYMDVKSVCHNNCG